MLPSGTTISRCMNKQSEVTVHCGTSMGKQSEGFGERTHQPAQVHGAPAHHQTRDAGHGNDANVRGGPDVRHRPSELAVANGEHKHTRCGEGVLVVTQCPHRQARFVHDLFDVHCGWSRKGSVGTVTCMREQSGVIGPPQSGIIGPPKCVCAACICFSCQ